VGFRTGLHFRKIYENTQIPEETEDISRQAGIWYNGCSLQGTGAWLKTS
jgi:hypothetical protein